VQVEPASVDFVNDETGKRGYVNWEDENMNIGLPVAYSPCIVSSATLLSLPTSDLCVLCVCA